MFSHPLLFNKPYVQPLGGDFFFQFYRGGDFITTSDRSNQFVSVGKGPFLYRGDRGEGSGLF